MSDIEWLFPFTGPLRVSSIYLTFPQCELSNPKISSCNAASEGQSQGNRQCWCCRVPGLLRWRYIDYPTCFSGYIPFQIFLVSSHTLHIPTPINRDSSLGPCSFRVSCVFAACLQWPDRMPWKWAKLEVTPDTLKPSGKCSLPLLARNPKPFQKGTSWL